MELHELESIRLPRQLLEKWHVEPFFRDVARGCFVRIGLQGGDPYSPPLYRVGEVLGLKEFEDHPYILGGRRTCKRFLLDFGESQQWYPMSSVSNQPFDELELRNRIRDYYKFVLSSSQSIEDSSFLRDLPPAMRTQLIVSMNRELISSCPLFHSPVKREPVEAERYLPCSELGPGSGGWGQARGWGQG